MGGELDEGIDMIKTYCMEFSKNEFLKECKKIFKKSHQVPGTTIQIFNSSTWDAEVKKFISFIITVCVHDIEDMCMCVP